MSNYQSHNPRQFEQQRQRGSRLQGSSGNLGQYDDDLYDQQQEERYAWNHDPDYREIENRGYGSGGFEQRGPRGGYDRQNLGQQFGNEEAGYPRERYAQQGIGSASTNRRHPRDTRDNWGQSGQSTWGQGSEGSYAQGDYPDYNTTTRSRNFQGSNAGRQWDNPQRGGQDRSRVSFANRWPAEGYQTHQPFGANPASQNNPARSNEEYGRGAYGLTVDQPADYSLGGDGSFDHHGYGQGHRGRGPKGYERSDERVREDICERLAQDPRIDASEITVTVKAGVATLEGTIDERVQKHRAEDIADSCSGVKDVQNRLNVLPRNLRNQNASQLDESDSKNSTQQKPTRQ